VQQGILLCAEVPCLADQGAGRKASVTSTVGVGQKAASAWQM